MDATVTERCLSSTAGQIDVGGKIKFANFPNVHSVFTDAAHRLCNCTKIEKKQTVRVEKEDSKDMPRCDGKR